MTPILGAGGIGRRDLWVSLLIALCCLLVYNANRRAISAGDAYPARYLPFAIWQHHTLLLNPVAPLANQGRGRTAHWMLYRPNGLTISLYPVTLPVLVSPLYLPAVAYLRMEGWTERRLDHVARIMEKLSASLVAALSAALLYLLLRRRVETSAALLLTIAYAFGTTTWVVSSQALWQHGMAELLLVGALLCLTVPSTAPRAIAAGLLCGLIAANRPPDTILAAALGAYGLFWAGRRSRAALAALIGAAALPMLLTLLYNLAVADHFAGGYGRVGKATFFEHGLLSGLAGLLFSPTRGLFVFSPFLLFLVLAWRHRPMDRDERGLTLAVSAGVVLQLLLYAKTDWRTGISWGPRYLTDLLPLLVWLLAPVAAALRGLGRACFVLAVGAAVVIQAIGAFWYTGVTDLPLFAVTSGPDRMRAAWDWRNAPFVASLQHGLAPADLMVEMRGSFDAIETAGGPAFSVTAGQAADAVGWALAGDATPWQVAILVDGRQNAVSRDFHDRPDVRAALNEASPAGWRVPIDTAGLAPGKHRVAFIAWAFENGASHYLGERELTVHAPGDDLTDFDELDGAFETAAARVRAHQQGPGYWLTTHTTGTRFKEPRHREMNTYLTALLIDLLDPLAATADVVERARRHLGEQIEDGGLVRYHGLPDAPGIGTLGCAITPDADDTALAWRLAPSPDRRRLPDALATLDRYRTGEGLYQTWLAPVEAYQCLNPGSDPNPADLTIQMHVLLMLARERPAAGRALCEALRPVVDQDRVWVYYRRAPLVPMLRLPDLQRAGCGLELPESRMRTEVPGQEVWVSVVRMLGSPSVSAAEAHAVLRQLAKDDFALLRESPPLLYHNDLTASVSRYYWSEDVGYALWLRLYHEYSHPGPPPVAS